MNAKILKKSSTCKSNSMSKFGYITKDQIITKNQNQTHELRAIQCNCEILEPNYLGSKKMLQIEAERQRNTGRLYSNLYPIR